MNVVEDELSQLHKAGFAHRGLSRPSNLPGEKFDNILLTSKGIRLIDVGISALRKNVGTKLFDKFVELELQELEIFKTFFLTR
jgi:serine/threonine protein kinase